MRIVAVAAVLVSLSLPSAARAAPGLGEKIYGATIEPGETEFELRYGRLGGGPGDGEDALIIEGAHHFGHFYAAALGEFEREPPGARKLSAIAGEVIVPLGRIPGVGVDTAVYGEYAAALDGPDAIETKLLLQKRAGAFDGRLNLIAEKTLSGAEPIGFGYAASADVEVAEEIRIGAAAIGELGSTRRLTTRTEHFAGPVAKAAFEHVAGGEFEVEAGYLFAIGRARDEANGQFRLLLEFAKHF